MDHSSCVPGSTRNVCFGSRILPLIRVPGPTYSTQCLRSRVPCITRKSLGFHIQGPKFRVQGLTHDMGPKSRSQVPPKVPGLGSHVWDMLFLRAPTHLKFHPEVKFSILTQVEKNCCHTWVSARHETNVFLLHFIPEWNYICKDLRHILQKCFTEKARFACSYRII